jgi:hypothetical protein
MIVTLQNATMIGTMKRDRLMGIIHMNLKIILTSWRVPSKLCFYNIIMTSTNKISSAQQGKNIYKGKKAMMFYGMGAIEF